jgi:hypothetical protein
MFNTFFRAKKNCKKNTESARQQSETKGWKGKDENITNGLQ